MIRDNRYKLTLYHNVDVPDRDPEGELHDLAEDPPELRNLWVKQMYAPTRVRSTGRLFDWTVAMDTAYNGARGGEALTFQAE
jgi:hypothetical protein